MDKIKKNRFLFNLSFIFKSFNIVILKDDSEVVLLECYWNNGIIACLVTWRLTYFLD